MTSFLKIESWRHKLKLNFLKNFGEHQSHDNFGAPMTFGLEVRPGGIFTLPRVTCVCQIPLLHKVQVTFYKKMRVKFYFQIKYKFLKHCRSINVRIKKNSVLFGLILLKTIPCSFFLLFFGFSFWRANISSVITKSKAETWQIIGSTLTPRSNSSIVLSWAILMQSLAKTTKPKTHHIFLVPILLACTEPICFLTLLSYLMIDPSCFPRGLSISTKMKWVRLAVKVSLRFTTPSVPPFL